MSAQNSFDLTLQESWASAFVDGEVTLSEQAGWSDALHEQLFYYTMTRQVLRGEASHGPNAHFVNQRATWVAFWARVDAA